MKLILTKSSAGRRLAALLTAVLSMFALIGLMPTSTPAASAATWSCSAWWQVNQDSSSVNGELEARIKLMSRRCDSSDGLTRFKYTGIFCNYLASGKSNFYATLQQYHDQDVITDWKADPWTPPDAGHCKTLLSGGAWVHPYWKSFWATVKFSRGGYRIDLTANA